MFQEFRLDLEGLAPARRGSKSTGYQNNLYALTKPEVAGLFLAPAVKNRIKRVHKVLS